MKSPIAVLLVALLMAASATAQYAPIKQRARDASAKTTERQNATAEATPPPAPPPTPAPGPPPGYAARYGLPPSGAPPGVPPAAEPTAPAAPIKPSAQQTAASKVKADITEARAKGEVTADMKKQFVQDLAALAQGRIRPSPGTVSRFGERLLTTLAAKTASPADDTKLVKSLVIFFNCAGLPTSRLQELNEELRTVLTKSGVTDADAGLVAENLAAVVSDIQSGVPN